MDHEGPAGEIESGGCRGYFQKMGMGSRLISVRRSSTRSEGPVIVAVDVEVSAPAARAQRGDSSEQVVVDGAWGWHDRRMPAGPAVSARDTPV
jgi:hypothetical protein